MMLVSRSPTNGLCAVGSWMFQLACIVTLASIVSPVESSPEFSLCEDINNTTVACCKCYIGNCGNEEKCPDGFQPSIEEQSALCKQGTTPATTTTTKTTTTTFVTTTTTAYIPTTTTTETGSDATNDVTSVTEVSTTEAPAKHDSILCHKCKQTTYFNGSACLPCHASCVSSCRGPSLGDCDACMYNYNNSCVEACPNGTNSSSSPGNTGEFVCTKPEVEGDESDGIPIAIIAGAAGGGAFLVLIVVIVTIVICRRKRSTPSQTRQKTRMSEIIESRVDGEDKKPEVTASRPTRTRPPNYENQPAPGPMFSRDLELQTDKVLRYTQDPTGKREVKKPVNNSTEEDYANLTSIKVAEQSRKEQEEIKQLGVAPSLPPSLQRPANQNARTPVDVPDDVEDYIDMDQSPLTKPAPGSPTYTVGPDDVDQEDYENLQTKKSVKTATKSNKPNPNTSPELEFQQEDYENVAFGTKTKDKQGSNQRNVTATDNGDTNFDDNLEDYANVEAMKKNGAGEYQKNVTATDNGDDNLDDNLEDYANVEAMKKNVGDEPVYQNFGKRPK